MKSFSYDRDSSWAPTEDTCSKTTNKSCSIYIPDWSFENIEFDTIDQIAKEYCDSWTRSTGKIQNLGISDDEQQLHDIREARMIYDNNMTLKQVNIEIDLHWLILRNFVFVVC